MMQKKPNDLEDSSKSPLKQDKGPKKLSKKILTTGYTSELSNATKKINLGAAHDFAGKNSFKTATDQNVISKVPF